MRSSSFTEDLLILFSTRFAIFSFSLCFLSICSFLSFTFYVSFSYLLFYSVMMSWIVKFSQSLSLNTFFISSLIWMPNYLSICKLNLLSLNLFIFLYIFFFSTVQIWTFFSQFLNQYFLPLSSVFRQIHGFLSLKYPSKFPFYWVKITFVRTLRFSSSSIEANSSSVFSFYLSETDILIGENSFLSLSFSKLWIFSQFIILTCLVWQL